MALNPDKEQGLASSASSSAVPGDVDPPSYDEVMRRFGAVPLETNIDESEDPEEEQRRLFEDHEEPTEAGYSETKGSAGETDDEDGEKERQRVQSAMRRTLQRSRDRRESLENIDGDELEMMSFLDEDTTEGKSDRPGSFRRASVGEVEMVMVDNSYVDVQNGSTRRRQRDVDENSAERGGRPEWKDYDWKWSIKIPFVTYLVNRVVRGCQWSIDTWHTLSLTKKAIVLLTVLLVVGILLLLTLLPASFIYVEYYEYGLSRNRYTGVVDFDRVYEFGCYLMAPQDEMMRLPSTSKHLTMSLNVMTNESLGISVQFTMQYYLKRDEVGALVRKYGEDYEGVINSVTESTVKNTAVDFSLDQYRLERKKVEAVFRKRLKNVLTGNCCKPCCKDTCKVSMACSEPFCYPPGQCFTGLHVYLSHFQMGRVWIPDTIMEKFVTRMVLKVNAEREFYIQEKAVEVKATERDVKRLLNQAKEVLQEAEAKRRVIVATSEAQANRVIEMAYQKALAKVFSRLNITKEENKLSFMYVKALEHMKQNVYAYNSGFNSAFTP